VHFRATPTGGAPLPGRARANRPVSPPTQAKTESGSSATTSLNFRRSLTASCQLDCSDPTLRQKPSDSIGPVVVLVCRFELRLNVTPAPKGENVPK
jgi:hypothetical protein